MSALVFGLALTFVVSVAALALAAIWYGFRHTAWYLSQRKKQRRRARVRSLS